MTENSNKFIKVFTQPSDQANGSERSVRIRIVLSLILFIAHFFISDVGARTVILIIAYILTGVSVAVDAVCDLLHGEFFNEKLLMTVASIGAAVLGEWDEAAAVMLFYTIGEWIQDLAVDKARERIGTAVAARPDTAVIVRNEQPIEVVPEDILVGDTVIIGVGKRVPVDGTVTKGSSRVDNSAVTGESNTISVSPGKHVFAGAVNQVSEITIKAEKISADSATGRLLKAVDSAAAAKPKLERFITRFSQIYTPSVLILALVIAVIPPAFDLGSIKQWAYRSLNFLVISCPCALVLSIPLAFYAGLGQLSKIGLLLKGADGIDRLAALKAIIFDKTGTLTDGSYSVLGVEGVDGRTKEEIIRLAASAERTSPHPIAKAIRNACADIVTADYIEEHNGMGVSAEVSGHKVYVGNRLFMEQNGISVPEKRAIYVGIDGRYGGHLLVGDSLRPSAEKVMSRLRDMEIESVMLTGDNADKAKETADMVGIRQYAAELLPEEKLERLYAIRQQYGIIAFVGDGMNDAPALKASDIGIAVAEGGTDMAAESSDALMLGNDLMIIPQAVETARRTLRIAKVNIVFALVIKVSVMILSAIGLCGMWAAVIADVGTALLCILHVLAVCYFAENKRKNSCETKSN